MCIHGCFVIQYVAMPDPDIVDSATGVADMGVINTSSTELPIELLSGQNKKNRKRSLKAQAKINARAKREQEACKANSQDCKPIEKERTIMPIPQPVKTGKSIELPQDAYLVDNIEAIVFAPRGQMRLWFTLM